VRAAAGGEWRQMLPRERGAWGLLLQPFLAGVILGRVNPALAVGAALMLLAGFALRAPLLWAARALLARRSGWRDARQAAWWAGAEMALAAACLWGVWPALTPPWRMGLLVGGPLFTVLAVWIGVKNQQRSRLFQTLSAAVLALSGPLAIELGKGSVPRWGWALWAVFVLHGAVAIQLVHERLERRAAARPEVDLRADSRPFLVAVFVQMTAGLGLAAAEPAWALPPLASSVYALAEWRRLLRADALREPLTRVGWRTLGFSVVHVALSVAAFWRAASFAV